MYPTMSDREFKKYLDVFEWTVPALLDDSWYGPLARAAGKDVHLERMRTEWRERQARAERRRRARWIGHEAEWAES
jgi:hypothetical protein